MKVTKFFDERTDQSEVKARIVQKYFYAWANVITPTAQKSGGRIAYIDLYAGPGRYKDGAASTPLLVLQHAIADPKLASMLREAEGRQAAPTAVIVDSQSVKTTEAGGPRGFDAGKKVKGRKRHLAVDTLGLPIECQITVASTQDRDALAPLLKAVRRNSPWVKMSFVDGGYQGDEARSARRLKRAASP